MLAMNCVRQRIGSDIDCLTSAVAVPGFGLVPVNAFVLHAAEPVLIDTGVLGAREAFLARLRESIEPDSLRWIWLTHLDPDHTGSLAAILEMAPRARVVTSFVGLAKLGLLGIMVSRFHLLNPGQALDVGGRRLIGLKPPIFDAPETTALFDTASRTLYSADFFGALLESVPDAAEDIAPARMRDGMITWATLDAPWLSVIDRARFDVALDAIRQLAPTLILSSHLPPARRLLDTLLQNVRAACDAPPFVGPDQAAFEALVAAPDLPDARAQRAQAGEEARHGG